MKKFDFILASAMVVIALVWFLFNYIFYSEAEIVNVYKDNTLIESYSLKLDGEYSVIDSSVEMMRVSVKNGIVDVTYANCPDKLCQHQMPISRSNETIVCLPNKIVVIVENKKNDLAGDVDAVTY